MSKRLLLTVMTLGACAALAGSAEAETQTLRLFSKADSAKYFDASGNPVELGPQRPPQAGDALVDIDTLYRGTHVKHSAKAIGTDHLRCVVQSFDMATDSFVGTCDVQIALRGGMVFADAQTVDIGDTTTVPLTGGTGAYKHLKGGSVTAKTISDDSDDADLVVKLKR